MVHYSQLKRARRDTEREREREAANLYSDNMIMEMAF